MMRRDNNQTVMPNTHKLAIKDNFSADTIKKTLIQADATTTNQAMMTRTPLFQDDALSFNQAKISNPPDPCSFKNVVSSVTRNRVTQTNAPSGHKASGTNCLFTSVGLRCMKPPYANEEKKRKDYANKVSPVCVN